MAKVNSQGIVIPAGSYILAPGAFLYDSNPTPPKLCWSAAQTQIKQKVYSDLQFRSNDSEEVQADEIKLVKIWIQQLVLKELGPALARVDKDQKFNIVDNNINFEQAKLISDALMDKARRELSGM